MLGVTIDHSEQMNELAEALAMAQSNMKNPEKDALNPRLRTRYSSMAAIRDACVPQLSAQGIAVTQLLGASRRHSALERLTPREREVLGLMAEGRSNAGIAAKLVITERAVEKHVTNIFTKLDLPPAEGAHRRVLAVLRWLGEDA